ALTLIEARSRSTAKQRQCNDQHAMGEVHSVVAHLRPHIQPCQKAARLDCWLSAIPTARLCLETGALLSEPTCLSTPPSLLAWSETGAADRQWLSRFITFQKQWSRFLIIFG